MGDWTQHQGILKTSDGHLKLTTQANGDLIIAADKARAKGGKYYLDPDLLNAGEGEFTSVGNTMRMTVDAAQTDAILDVLMVERGYLLLAENYQDIAKAQLGIETPRFVEVPPIEKIPIEPMPSVTLPDESRGIAINKVPIANDDIIVPQSIIPTIAQNQSDIPHNFPIADAEFLQVNLFDEPELVPDAIKPIVEANLPPIVEDFLSQTLPDQLAANSAWQTLKWSDQSDEAVKEQLQEILQTECIAAPPEVQALIERPAFANWLTDHIFATDRWELKAEYEYDPALDLASCVADTQTVLNTASRAFAFGVENGKAVTTGDGALAYRSQEFEFRYQPDSDTFTVSDLHQQQVIAQSIAGEVHPDIEIDAAIVARFEQLGQLMDDRGMPPAQPPRQSYAQANADQQFSVSPEDLQQWHKQASEIARSPDYLQRLENTAAKAQQTGTLPKAANNARLEDRTKWQQQVEGVIHDARLIVQTAGIPTQSGRAFAGAIFRIVADDGNNLAIHAKDRGIVLEVTNGQVVTANVTKQDADRFAKQVQLIQHQQHQPRAVGREP